MTARRQRRDHDPAGEPTPKDAPLRATRATAGDSVGEPAGASPLGLGDFLPGTLDFGRAITGTPTGAAAIAAERELAEPGAAAVRVSAGALERGQPDEGAAAADGDTKPRRHARMSLSVEPHPLTRQHYRVNQDSAAQRELTLTYSLDGQHAEVRVTADRHEVTTSGPLSDLLPSPQANDLLVVLGEEVNGRVRGRQWNVDSAVERTFSYGIPELLGRMGRPRGGKSYEALLETARRLARLRIGAKGGAWREGGKRVQREVVTGLFDRLEIVDGEDAPGGARIHFTLSVDYARQLAESYRLLETGTYWLIDGDPARRLYRILDMACYAHNHRGEQTIRIPVAYLRDRIPIEASKTAHITRALDRYHEELVRVGFLAELPAYEPAAADDFRRFPSYPGHRAKLTSAVYRVVRHAPAPERRPAPLAGERGPAAPA